MIIRFSRFVCSPIEISKMHSDGLMISVVNCEKMRGSFSITVSISARTPEMTMAT